MCVNVCKSCERFESIALLSYTLVCADVLYQACVVDHVQLTETDEHGSEREVHGGSSSLQP